MTEASTVDKLDLTAISRRFDDEGYCVVPGVLTADEIEAAKQALDRLAAEDEAAGEALRYGPNFTNQRIHNLLNRADEFIGLVLHPVMLTLARKLLGYDQVLLSATSANITRPGGDSGIGQLHADQSMLPGTWPQRLVINTAFFLDEYTEENGATVAVRHSHKSPAPPPEAMPPESELAKLTGPAGSIALWDGHIHHATGLNRTADQQRRGIIATYFVPYLRTQENWCVSLNRKLLEKHAGLAALTGFEEWRTFGGIGIEGKRAGLNY
jgi:ectoine hydroxylase-related dioxygenase (phytanoyl-CoA dioxygenase family)